MTVDARRPSRGRSTGDRRATVRRGSLTALLVLPAGLLVSRPARPAARDRPRSSASASGATTGGYAGGFTFDNYAGASPNA